MNKDDIKKAYSLCASANNCNNCSDCPDCTDCASKAALDLIYEQEEKIKELTEEINFWHKINETALILTKEECDHKVILDEDHFERALNYERENVRKETAKKILILLGKGFDETKMTEFKNLPWYKLFCRELKQRYGVEVEE